jgi:plasmid stabilization system protein ParE
VTVRFLEIAELELHQAINWYARQAPGLGDAFLIEVLSAADRVARFPEGWQPLDQGIRRCRLSRFPYGLIYTIENGDILVLAVAHLHRRPEYWRDRLTRG